MSRTDPYADPRLISLYDQDNPAGPDHAFFRALADAVQARTIVDLGCGTGILTRTLARPGRTVIGIDPSAAMLDYAWARPGAGDVLWLAGDSSAIGDARAELAIMSGNVAQHIRGQAWPRTLRDIHDGLRPGGTLAFESRNPSARAWETWTEQRTRSSRDTDYGLLTEWLQVTAVKGDEVTFCAHNVFAEKAETLVETTTLVFRSDARLVADLAEAGLRVESIAGGWQDEPVAPASPLLVVIARRA